MRALAALAILRRPVRRHHVVIPMGIAVFALAFGAPVCVFRVGYGRCPRGPFVVTRVTVLAGAKRVAIGAFRLFPYCWNAVHETFPTHKGVKLLDKLTNLTLMYAEAAK